MTLQNHFTFINRFGSVYYLLEKTSSSGRVTRFFAKDPGKGRPLAKIPDGYRAEEKVSGLVFLIKDRLPKIPAEELKLIQDILTALGKNPHEPWIEKETIVIYEFSSSDIDKHPVRGDFTRWNYVPRREPGLAVMRFVLIDAARRTFLPQRFCFRGSVDDWIAIGEPGELRRVAERCVPFLGTDGIYELY